MPLRRLVARAVAWAALVGVCAYAVADQSADFLILMLAGLGAGWWLSVLPGRPAPPHAINAGLLGVLGVGGLQLVRLGVSVNAFAYFIGMLLIVKVFDLRRARDWGQALVLVTALYVSAVLTSNTLMTGVLLVVGSVLLFRAVLRYQIYAAADRAGDPAPAADAPMRRDLRSVQVGGGFAILAAATFVFVILPRNLGSDAFGNWGAPRGQTTGFTDEVELGGPGLISQSPTPVMDVTVTDRNDRNRGRADAPPIYLRGAVLEAYESGRWTRASSRRLGPRSQFIPESTPIRPWLSSQSYAWELELRVSIRNAAPGTTPLFTAWQPLEIRPIGSGHFIAHNASTGAAVREGSGGRVEYSVRIFDPRFEQVPEAEGAERTPVDTDAVPAPVAEYARVVLAETGIEADPSARPIGDDLRAVRALEKHLQSAFRYTLVDEPVPPGREPTVWFLTERREGHCEYYASALALMARSIGVNARVVTGYVASDYNEVTGQYVVRESNAHGWVEAEVAPGYWLVFDGTPPSDFYQIHQPAPSLLRSAQKLYETLEFAWATGVVGFDTGAQRRLLGDLSTDFGLRRFGGRMIDRLQTDGAGLVARAAFVAMIVFAASVSLGLLVVHRRTLLLEWWRALTARLRFRRKAAGRRSGRPGDRLHAGVLRALAAAGAPKPADRPLRTHLAAHAGTLPPDLARALAGACELLYRLRFAPAAGPDEGELRGALRAVRASENRVRSVRAQAR